MKKQRIYSLGSRELYNKTKLPVYFRSAGLKVYAKGEEEENPEFHSPFYEVIWCKRGVGEVELFKENFVLSPNDIFVYYPHERHFLRGVSEEWELYWFTFDGPAAASFWDGYCYPRKMHTEAPLPEEELVEIFNKINDASPRTTRLMLSKLCYLLALIGENTNANNEPMEQALNLINTNLDKPDLNVNFLAKKLKMHRATLTKLFNQQMLAQPGVVIARQRMEYAKTLLKGTDFTVGEISQRCGFNSESSFCRFFLRNIQLSPTQFRQDSAEQDK